MPVPDPVAPSHMDIGKDLVAASATPLVLALLASSLTGMVDFATIVAFLTAPVLGYLNLRAVTSAAVPAEFRPGRALRALSWGSLVVLTAFGLVYLASLLR